jgi:hypothetical protein
MQLKTRDIDRSLPEKGFAREKGDHVYFSFLYEGKDCGISTYFSHGDREIGDPLIARMAKQLKLSKRDFVRLVECPMNQSDYVERLRNQSLLPSTPTPRTRD